jgi:hypothetical protein
LTHADCEDYKLNLVVRKSILNEVTIKNILDKCRKLVGHFYHLNLAQEKLKKKQLELKQKIHKLEQV